MALGADFVEDNFSMDLRGWEVENGSGGNTSDRERQVKLHFLTCCLPPAMQAGSKQAADWSVALGWGIPVI